MAKQFKVLLKIGKRTVGKVAEYDMYHVFPDKDSIQENHFKPFNLIHDKRYYMVKRLPQKDGSRFYAIWSRYTVFDVKQRLENIVKIPIYVQTSFTTESLLQWLADTGGHLIQGVEKGTWEYVAYWTHTFLNGRRVIPVIIDHVSQTVIDVSCVFSELVAEDNMGVIVDDVSELDLGPMLGIAGIPLKANISIIPSYIRYFSGIRMCASCGVVSDHGEALEKPWLEKMMSRSRKKVR